MSSAADRPAWLDALRAAAPEVRWLPAEPLLGCRDRPGVRLVGEVVLAADVPPAQLLFDPQVPTALLVRLGPEQPGPLWIPAGCSAESLAAALSPYRARKVPSRLQLPPAQRRFVGHTESLGQSFGELVARLAAHPALEPTGWGSAYPDDPWPRPLPADLPTPTRALLQQRFTAQSPDPPRSLTFVTRWSRSLVTLEDHDGALVLAIAHAPVAAIVAPGESEQRSHAATAAPEPHELHALPVDARWAVAEIPSASAEALQRRLLQPLPPGSSSSAQAAAADDRVTAGDRLTALLGLAAIFAGDPRLVEVLRCVARTASGDWPLRAAVIAVAQRQGLMSLLRELYKSETEPELRAELHALTATASEGGPPQLTGVEGGERGALGADAGEGGSGSEEVADPVALQGRAEAAVRSGNLEAATRLLDRALELGPLDCWAYLARARVGAAAGRGWSALIDVTTALALARRQGLRLQEMQALQTALCAQLAAEPVPPTAASELHAVANLGALLRAGRWREVEEVAELLLTLPGRAALWWLAIGLARRERGRPEQATAAFAAALVSAPQLRTAHFLLGECRRELGDLDGARQAFAQLDPPAGERPPHPSLLEAYADELLGSQAPWEAREHAFARVQLLRELGHPAEALAVTGELLRREPTAADALLAHGILLLELEQPAAALAALDRGRTALRPAERLLSEPDPLGTLQLYRAIALQSVGQKDTAEAALRHALRLSPERAAEAAADPQLAALTPAALPPSPAGYAALRDLARLGLADPRLGAPGESGGPADPLASSSAQAHAQDAAPRADVASAPDRSSSEAGLGLATGPVDAAAPAGTGASVSRAASRPAAAGPLEDEELIWTALRGQVAELLVDALAALDDDADAGARRELVARAVRGLGALRRLAPQTLAAQSQRVRALIESAAAALGISAELGEFDTGP